MPPCLILFLFLFGYVDIFHQHVTPHNQECRPVPLVHLQILQYPGSSLGLDWGDCKWELYPLMFLPLNNGDYKPRPPPPDLWSTGRECKLKLPDEGNQEHVHLKDPGEWGQILEHPGINKKTNANLHPMQVLTPPEKVALQGRQP